MEDFKVHIFSMVTNMFDDFHLQKLNLHQGVIHK